MRTVFVIGAGANVEIGMPSGEELKTKIANILDFTSRKDGRLNGDKTVYHALEMRASGQHGHIVSYVPEKLLDVAINISEAMPVSISIDNFIEAHKGDHEIAFCGKLAIVKAILAAEAKCITPMDDLLKNSWYPLFFQKITEGCHVDELPARLNDISFIIFNYDRCFEFFMYTALKRYYNIGHERAMEFVQKLHINHPYGTVGDLWKNNGRLTFGISPDFNELIPLTEKIKTFSESVDQSQKSSERIQYLVERADRIIFLGFAYHEQNLDLLFNHYGKLYVMDGVPLSDKITCYGTGYGISGKDLSYLHEMIIAKHDLIKECDISGITCTQFFKDFWYRLTFKT